MGAPTTSTNAENSRPTLPPRVHHAPKPDRKRGHQTSVRERQAIIAVAVAAGFAGAFSAASPTNYLISDVVLRAGVAAAISLAASRARRWTWLVLAGLAMVGAPEGVWFVVVGGGLVFAFATTVVPRRRIYGAIIGATSAQGLLRFTDASLGRSSVVLFTVAVVPVFVSAYIVAPRRVRRRIHQAAAIIGGLVLASSLLFAIAAGLAYGSTERGARQAKAGLSAAREGRGDDAANSLRDAAASFRSANNLVDAWWVKPAGAVPFVAQQARAVQVVTAEGWSMSDVASRTATQADVQKLKYENGRVDVERLQSLATPLSETAAAFTTASANIKQARSPWLVPPLASGVDDVANELHDALPEVQLAADAARTAPGLLGIGASKHYLVLFTQPAESRALGGFVGNWAELTATDGRVEMTRSGRAADLNDTPGRDDRAVTSPPTNKDYVDRYSRFRPGYYFQDVTLSPDLPSVASAAAQLYPMMGGDALDGVVTLDPYALAALLEFTGPITVDGFDQPLTKDNAAEILVKDQYTTLASNDARKDFLDDASRKTFDALVKGNLPSPKLLAEKLGPMVAQRRLMFTSFDPTADELLGRMKIDGAFPKPDGSDFFELVTQNHANNKIDLYLHREIEYATNYNPATGDVEATMTITLHNDAPNQGPPAVIGSNDQGLPPGTNSLYLSLYTPLGLRSARSGDQPASLEFQHELGFSVYSEYVEIPPGQAVTLQLALFGQLDASPDYRLRVGVQPLVNRDEVRIHVRPQTEWEITKAPDLVIDPGKAAASTAVQPAELVELDAEMARP